MMEKRRAAGMSRRPSPRRSQPVADYFLPFRRRAPTSAIAPMSRPITPASSEGAPDVLQPDEPLPPELPPNPLPPLLPLLPLDVPPPLLVPPSSSRTVPASSPP
jgi:hypothetical protein